MMPKSLLKFLLAACTFLVFQNLKAQTETEPNNTKATANTVALNGKGSGHISPAGDVDWWKVTTTSDGKLDVTVTDYSNDYTNYFLYDNNGTTLLAEGTTGSNTSATFSTDGLAVGTYYIEFTGYNTASDTSTYSFTNTLTPAPVANDPEPDSTRALANILPLDGGVTGHVGYYYNNHRDSSDWYKVTTTSDGLLRLTITTEPSSLNAYINCYLYDNNGTTLLAEGITGSSTSTTLSTDGLAAGTYYVRMTQYNNTDYVSYKLADSLFLPPVANDPEPDSTRALALTLPLDGGVTGHVGYYYNNHRDSSDWYKVTTTSDGLLRLTITTEPSSLNAYINCYLYDNNGTTLLAEGITGSSTSTTLSTDGLAAGTYYVRMTQYNNTDYVSYKLADSLFLPPVANDKEPNNSKLTADSLPVNSTVTGHIGYYYNNLRDTSDWYKLTTNTDGDIRLTITTEPSSLNAYINYFVFDNDGTTLLSEGTIGSNTSNAYNIDGLAKGTYYVRMSQYNQNDYVSYKLQDSIFKYQYAADTSYEPNAFAAQAKQFYQTAERHGHFGFYYNHVRDTTDWFKINYTGTGNLSLVLNHLSHISDGAVDYVNFYVYKDTGTAALYANTFGGEPSDAVNLTGLFEGYYYVKITQYNSNDFEAYSLLDSFVQVDKALISINTTKTTINSSSCGSDSITYTLSASHSPYTVRLYKNGVLYDSTIAPLNTATFKGLSAGSYYATVYGDGATDSAYSKSTISVVTPPVPTGLVTTGIGVHTATLNWAKLSCVNYYTVQYKVQGTSTWTVVNTTGDSAKLAGLLPYTSYVWEVSSVDTAKGQTFMSTFSDTLVFKTLSDTAHIALTFKGEGSACNSDTLTYTSTNSAAPYTVTLYRNGVVYGSPLSVASVASFYNVPPGNYYATSTGTGSGGSYGKSDTTQIVPPAPTVLDTTGITATTATLHWNMVSCANYYTVQYKIAGTATWTVKIVSADSLKLIALSPSTKYVWEVAASDSFNKQTVTGLYSVVDTFTTSTILPVTLISFNAAVQNSAAILTWSTAAEINNKGFEIEKSTNGLNFSNIGFVVAHKSGSVINNYSYTDNDIASGSTFYRLKQIDLDGAYHYSYIVKLSYAKFAWMVYGNPAGAGNTHVQLMLDRSANVTVQVVSINGSTVQLISKGNLTAGCYTIPLTLNNVSAGIYIVKLMVDNKAYTTQIVKQ